MLLIGRHEFSTYSNWYVMTRRRQCMMSEMDEINNQINKIRVSRWNFGNIHLCGKVKLFVDCIDPLFTKILLLLLLTLLFKWELCPKPLDCGGGGGGSCVCCVTWKLAMPNRVPCGVVGRELVGVEHWADTSKRCWTIFWHASWNTHSTFKPYVAQVS